jgi:hypothetical protein
MNWAVDWTEEAKQALADIWLTAADRRAVTSASNRIDEALGRDPLGVGESRVGLVRILIDLPLGVYYEVDLARRDVSVFAVWHV